MYKRKPRILFLSEPANCAASIAEIYAGMEAPEIIECRAVYLRDQCQNAALLRMLAEDGVDTGVLGTRVLTPSDLEWADLLVLIGETQTHTLDLVGISPPTKTWPISPDIEVKLRENEEFEGFCLLRNMLQARIRSLLGGIAMMSSGD